MKNELISKSYLPALDGIRGVAILLVFMSHLGLGHFIPGGFGVTLFFFISGLLITRLLICEYSSKRKINLKDFYIRRLLRLYPSLLFFILTTTLTLSITGIVFNYKDILAAIFYFQNYYMIYFMSHNVNRFFDILWSLSVEEHFYLIYPILFYNFVKSRNILLILLVSICIFILGYRIYYMESIGVTPISIGINYNLTHTRADSILFGCISAVLLSINPNLYLRITSHYISILFCFIILLLCFIYRADYFRETYRYTLQGVVFVSIIPVFVFKNKFPFIFKILTSQQLIFIGKISYSLYLFHWLALRTVDFLTHSNSFLSLKLYSMAGVLGILLSIINYYFIEIPMKKVRKYFGSSTI